MGSGFQPLLSDAHVAACGMEIEGLWPFDASRGLIDALSAVSGYSELFLMAVYIKRGYCRSLLPWAAMTSFFIE